MYFTATIIVAKIQSNHFCYFTKSWFDNKEMSRIELIVFHYCYKFRKFILMLFLAKNYVKATFWRNNVLKSRFHEIYFCERVSAKRTQYENCIDLISSLLFNKNSVKSTEVSKRYFSIVGVNFVFCQKFGKIFVNSFNVHVSQCGNFIKYFSITQILREINFGAFRSSKNAIFCYYGYWISREWT